MITAEEANKLANESCNNGMDELKSLLSAKIKEKAEEGLKRVVVNVTEFDQDLVDRFVDYLIDHGYKADFGYSGFDMWIDIWWNDV